ncbi:MAG: hypothetical protein RLZ16_1109 [Bacteroidota bacterium]
MKVNESTYENYFLLYIDNELTAEEKIAVETFVLANPIYASILQQLQQTKLGVTDEVYEDKALLYRFEEMEAGLDTSFKQSLYRKEATIIRPNFKKQYYAIAVSVAALFILIFGYQNYEYKKGVVIKQLDGTVVGTGNQNTTLSNEDGGLLIKEAPSIKKIAQQVTAIRENASSNNNVNNVIGTETILTENEAMGLVSSEVIARENYTSAPITISMSDATNMDAAINIQQDLANEQAIEYNEIDTDDNDRVVYIASFEVDTDKFRGITRKVGSLFKRNRTNKEK